MIDHSKGSFFGRRVGKPLRAARREIFEAAIGRLQPDLGRPAPADLRDMFASPVDEVWMEIGFGGGEHLLHEAGRLPRTGFIGVEPFVSSLAKTVADIEAAELGNLGRADECEIFRVEINHFPFTLETVLRERFKRVNAALFRLVETRFYAGDGEFR